MLNRKFMAITSLLIGIATISFNVFALQDKDFKTVLVIADYTSLEDFSECGFIKAIMEKGYTALVNNRQPGKPSQYKAKLVLGSGKRLEMSPEMINGGNAESIGYQFYINTGNYGQPKNVLYTDIVQLKRKNSDSEYARYIGYVGDTVVKNGGSTCILGNGDTDKPNRSTALAAMDSSGVVSLGEVENVLMKDSFFPYGIRTDYKRLAELYKQFLPASSFIVVDTGDMERLETYRANMDDGVYRNYKREILKQIDGLVSEICENGGFSTLIVMSTFPSEENYNKKDRLTPIIVYNGKGRGLLYSESTRREGIILNTDISDYILYELGYPNKNRVSEVESEKAFEKLVEMNREIVGVSRLRLPVLTGYAAYLIFSLILVFFILLYGVKKSRSFSGKIIRIVSYSNLAIPLVLLYMPVFGVFDLYSYILLVFSQAFLIAFSVDGLIRDGIKKILILNLLLFTALFMDLISGSTLMKQSVLGYDAVIGARFFGMGNEYAGAFIGCSLMLFGSIKGLRGEKTVKEHAMIYFIFCTLLLGLTTFGANFGGSVAGLCGYTLAYHLIYDIQFNWKRIMWVPVFCAAAVVLLVAADLSGLQSSSHLGNFVKDVSENGIMVLVSTVERKFEMNLRLIRYTIWTKVLIFIILTITFMFYKHLRILRYIFRKYWYMKHSWVAASAASIAGFSANDSGIVLAATAMIYVVFTMLPFCVEELDGQPAMGNRH